MKIKQFAMTIPSLQIPSFLLSALLVATALFTSRPSFAGSCSAQLRADPLTVSELITEVENDIQAAEEYDISAAPEEEIREMTEVEELDYLIDLVVPQRYKDNRAAYEAAKHRAETELLPRLNELKMLLKEMRPNLTFPELLSLLGDRYDRAVDSADKKKILDTVMNLFSIPREGHYINLIANGHQSKEFKMALYHKLSDRFTGDPLWQPPLERAMRTARLK